MKVRDIKLAARKALAGTEIEILEGPAASPEHRMVAQYEKIVSAVDQLDRQCFVIGNRFLRELSSQAPDNVTLKCLLLINKTAFKEPTEEEGVYLMQHAGEQAQYGLNVYPIVRDGWECAGKTTEEIKVLEEKNWIPLKLTQADMESLKDKFKKAGLPPAQIESQLQDFLTQCKRRRIDTPVSQP